ncbi:hypothetical protein CH63R_14525 [Colletotrichum higginsianum IMI 349063]|uniref:Uncharacterized protein n=1 Tax=Colletotrichum higginsianum (strain IMI 349063) TaxID=759273 RepID=A0A1B7XQB8_COLHI|nr:hypothetical protein CH63R_14525 [Colletotrichum higginsianum IMI 349063]OBR01953.1 hypothetical protein CH63R_14525 [Colletotrichum higginsianum IMI 349063]
MTTNAVFVPMGVQAFVPDYSSLRASGLLNRDVIEQLQLSHHRLMAKHNTRFVDVTNGLVRGERVGVYLSWTIPRAYRQGITATEKASVDHSVAKLKAGYTHELAMTWRNYRLKLDADSFKFRSIPTRYLIFRVTYSRTSSTPSSQIFVLESDRIRNINEADLGEVNVENLTSAFLNPTLSIEQ